jgi:tetratricopeptide (TPR) repeat protein
MEVMNIRFGEVRKRRHGEGICLLALLIIFLVIGCAGPEDKRDQFYSQALDYFEQGRFQEASLELRNAVKIDSQFAKGYALLGQCYMQMAEWRQAYANLNRAVELDPSLTTVQAILGLFLLRANQMDEAENKVQKALEQDPDNIDARLLQAVLHAMREETGKAEAGLEDIIAENPQSETAYLLLAQIREGSGWMVLRQGLQEVPQSRILRMRLIETLIANGQIDEAEEHFKVLLEQFPQAPELHLKYIEFLRQAGRVRDAILVAEQLIARQPQIASHRLRLAGFYLDLQETEQAKAVLEKGIEILEDPFQLQIGLGDLKKRQGELQIAEHLYREAAEQGKTPDRRSEARLRLAQLFLVQNKLDRAAAEIEVLRQEDPGNIQASAIMGLIYLRQNMPEDAITELRQVVKERPDLRYSFTALAQAHFQNQEPLNAVEVLKQAIDYDPDYALARENLANYFIGHQKWDQAEEHLKILIEQQPEKLEYQVALGDSYLRQGGIDQAMEIYEQIIDRHPDFLPAANNLAYIMAEKGEDLERARELAEKAAENGDAHALDTLGWVHYKQGNTELALKYLLEAKEKAADNESITKHLKAVRQ